MSDSTDLTERNESVRVLVNKGFRVQFSNEDWTVLAKPTSYSTVLTAQVDNAGKVNTRPLTEFLEELLA